MEQKTNNNEQQNAITKSMAYKCAEALVFRHNAIPQDAAHRAVIIISYRSLYLDLRQLGMEFMIASAIKPVAE